MAKISVENTLWVQYQEPREKYDIINFESNFHKTWDSGNN